MRRVRSRLQELSRLAQARHLTRREMLLVDLVVVALSLAGYELAMSSMEHHRDVLTLAYAAFLIIVSGHMADLLGMSPALLEIMAGVAIVWAAGPELEGLGELKVLADIGAMFLLFLAGTEIDVKLLRRRLRDSLALGLLGFIAPSLLALLVMRQYGLSLEAGLLLMAGFSATSVALTYAILKATGLLRSRAGQVALAAAMIADVLGMLLINFASASFDPYTLLYIPVLLAALALEPLLPRVSGGMFELETKLVLMAVLVLGIVSEVIGIHGVLTSFIMGVVVSETLRHRERLREKIEGVALGFFAPFFFVYSGASMKPSLIVEELAVILAIGAGVTLLKLGPSYLFFRSVWGVRQRHALLYSASVTPLLTVSIISASLGLSLGLIDERAYTWLMGVVLVTSGVALALVYKLGGRHGIEAS